MKKLPNDEKFYGVSDFALTEGQGGTRAGSTGVLRVTFHRFKTVAQGIVSARVVGSVLFMRLWIAWFMGRMDLHSCALRGFYKGVESEEASA